MESDELQLVFDEDLQSLNTLAIPSRSQYLMQFHLTSQLPLIRDFLNTHQCPLLILGGGSNVVLPDVFKGLTILMCTSGCRVISEDDQTALVECAAGANWHETVKWSIEQGFSGLENLALIPGTVGAAPIQNIGAYGVELADCFDSLTFYDLASGEIRTLNRQDCQFGYRDSVFKKQLKDSGIILSVTLRLNKRFSPQISYPALRDSLKQIPPTELTARQVMDAVIAIRQSKLPNPQEIPNAGSFFKNPIVTEQHFKELKARFPEIVAYPFEQGYKLAAGWLLDQAGWKGKQVEGISMHSQQALVLTNPNKASAKQLFSFIAKVKASIKERYCVDLEVEPRVY